MNNNNQLVSVKVMKDLKAREHDDDGIITIMQNPIVDPCAGFLDTPSDGEEDNVDKDDLYDPFDPFDESSSQPPLSSISGQSSADPFTSPAPASPPPSPAGPPLAVLSSLSPLSFLSCSPLFHQLSLLLTA